MKHKNQTPPAVVIITIIMLLFAALNITSARAEVTGVTYYVDNTSSLGTCSDSLNNGLTTDHPFCTINKGSSVAIGGDTVRVLAGTYAEKVVPAHVGSAGSPITFSAAPGVSVTGDLSDPATSSAFRLITKSYITVDGFTVTGTTQDGIYVLGSNNIIISNNHVSNSGSPSDPNQKSGIFFSGTTDSVINHNTTDHNSYNGIMVTGSCSTITVSNNTSYANSTQTSLANGIMVNSSTNNTIIHNLTYANEDSGIGFYVSSSNNLILGNVSYGNGDHGIDNNNSPNNVIVGNSIQGNVTVGINLEGTTGSGGATVQNNISVDNGINSPSGLYGNIRVDDLSITGTTLDYNIVYHHTGYVGSSTVITWGTTPYANLSDFQSDTGQETHGLQSDPLWVSPAPPATQPPSVVVGNYYLSAGSPAIDSANSDAPNEPTLDVDGNPRVDDLATMNTGAGTRAYDDRGAFEFQPSNSAPTNISLSNTSVAENQPSNTVVGTLSTTDPDAGNTFTYTLVSGTGDTDNGSFNISGSSLRTSAGFNYEVNSSYSIRVRSRDQGSLFFEKAFTITVTNVNETPTNISLSNTSVAENQPANTVVGAFSTTDPDAGNTFTYTLVSGTGDTDNGSFNISGSSLRASAGFNYEVKSSYSIRVRTSDQGSLFFEKAFTITVTNVNETPTDISLSNSSVAENQPANTVVGAFSTTDPDAGNTFTYTLVSGTGDTDNASFNISGSSLRASAGFNYEVKSSYSIRVRTSDQGSLFFEKAFTITVTNVNETPTDISLSNSSVAENQPANTVVGAFSTTDPDAGNTFTYTLVSGTGDTDNASFNISGSNLRTSADFDYEVKSSYSIRVRTSDQGSLFFEKAFTITVTNANETPTDLSLSNSSLSENQPINFIIGAFTGSDPDTGNTFTYTLVNGTGDTDNASFNISGGNLRTSAVFDFDTQHIYSIRVRCTDQDGLYFEQTFTITVTRGLTAYIPLISK